MADDGGVDRPAPEPGAAFGDPTRRTYLAQERTLLAWWRSALACLAVGLAVGRILPEVGHVVPGDKAPYVALGVAYGVLGVAFVAVGSWRQQRSRRVFDAGEFDYLPTPLLIALTAYLVLLAVGSVVVLFVNL